MSINKKPFGYWTRERCFEEAKKYEYKSDFRTKSKTAYNKALKNKWLNDYIWLKNKEEYAHHKKWTKERTEKEARKYNTQSDFQKNCPSAFSAAWRNGWLKDYDWFIKISKPTGYWTKENCATEALKYKTRTDFQQQSGGAYTAAWKNGWLDEITSHMKKRSYDTNLYSDKKYVIYIYKDEENKIAYVGLTNNINRRHKEHISIKDGTYDTVGNYFGININMPEILYRNLSAEDAMQKEEEMYQYYKNMGWTMLNDETKLGMIGSAHQKWTKNKCKKEALKYKSLKEFREKSNIAYDTALKNNWSDEYYWLEREEHAWWSKEECLEEAQKYTSKQEFKKNSPGAYWAANRNKWMKDYTWFKRPEAYNKKWTESVCETEAKKYNTTKEFMINSPRAYSAASKNNWLKNYTWLVKQQKEPWTEKECEEASKQYETIKDFHNLCPNAYNAAWKNGWLKNYTWLKYERTSKTEEECFNEAKKYQYVKDFKNNSHTYYVAAQRHGWLKNYTWLIRKK